MFSPGDGGAEHSIDRLSEGIKSLFYLALAVSVFEVERAVVNAPKQEEAMGPDASSARIGISQDLLRPPSLTIFAIEEPENHLAPHYLGRIVDLLNGIANSDAGQVVLTSHSPAIMSPMDPENVR